jgi:pSer/pThr/pTyr-binding forkhead associated (FHA) protein
MESPAAAHSSTPAELAQRLETERRGLPFLFWRALEGQRILVLEQGRERVTVGRGPEVDIGLDADEQVSRLHAEIERIGGEWTLADDGLSRNGSFLNGDRVAGRRRLADGDELRFGKTTVVFRLPEPSPSSATVATPDTGEAVSLTETQRRILIALSRPFREGSHYATPATNQQIADEVFLSLDSVKGHLRALFEKFGIAGLPQNQKRVRLVELALRHGVISVRDLG